MQLLQVKRLGPGKFYISHKSDLGFIGGNPELRQWVDEHILFFKRVGRKRTPGVDRMLKAEMLKVLKAEMSSGAAMSPSSGKWKINRMEKAGILKALKECEERGDVSWGAATSPRSGKGKRKISQPKEKESKRHHKSAPAPEVPRPVDPKPPTSEVRASAEISLERPGAFNLFEASFVVSPSRSASMQFLSQLVPDRDVGLVRGAPDREVLGTFAARFVEALVWGGETINRLTQAHREVASSRHSLDEVLGHKAELLKQLEELRATRDEEKRVLEAEKRALETELAATKARADWEIKSLRSEVDSLKGECMGPREGEVPKVLRVRDAEEHPASFLNVVQALEDMHEEGELGSETYIAQANTGLISEQLVSIKERSMRILKDFITKHNIPDDDVPDDEVSSDEEDATVTPPMKKSKKPQKGMC
ncbi:hypothetical protein F511_32537 [Dorcoceras hygrometricum]|uniref:Uncharacterized protein n=1 Tax=Dorcoceras hygrometricum TaxID=472368 RepID=A0A2Z7A0D4_9LAMI|nr:hypothetical protein F511_32537 [Dorcoceras hygrometricum]